MSSNQENIVLIDEENNLDGYKIIEWNVSDPTESLYAVVTPVKIK